MEALGSVGIAGVNNEIIQLNQSLQIVGAGM